MIFPWYIFSIATIEGSGTRASVAGKAGMSEVKICGIIVVGVAEEIMEVILELFRSVKTVLIEEFDWRYVVVT